MKARMSALGQKQTFAVHLPVSAKGQKRTLVMLLRLAPWRACLNPRGDKRVTAFSFIVLTNQCVNASEMLSFCTHGRTKC